jgi:hypothetical protein
MAIKLSRFEGSGEWERSTKCQATLGFSAFPRLKAGGQIKWRLIIDLRELNRYFDGLKARVQNA